MNKVIDSKPHEFFKRTKSIFLWTRFLNTPFWAFFNLFLIILYKDLQATPLQIMTMVAMKPMAALFSPYWSLLVYGRQDRLVSNLIWANILKFIPFLCFPWLHNTWLVILSFGFYMFLARGVIPAWMEIIKLNIQGKAREKTFATGSVIDYVGNGLLPVIFGWVLDDYDQAWRWIFFGTSVVGIFSTLLLYRLPSTSLNISLQPNSKIQLWQQVIRPFTQSWQLLKERPDFAQFQIGFLLGGSALIMMHTVFPKFLVDELNLSYVEISIAIALFKGIGFTLASPFWVKWFERVNIYRLSSWVTMMVALFPVILLASLFRIEMLYLAFMIYGIMQAGSELSWHLSGIVFAQGKDSSIYSGTNILAVGIRGCVAPILGSLICTEFNSITVMGISFLLGMIATERMRFYSERSKELTLGA